MIEHRRRRGHGRSRKFGKTLTSDEKPWKEKMALWFTGTSLGKYIIIKILDNEWLRGKIIHGALSG